MSVMKKHGFMRRALALALACLSLLCACAQKAPKLHFENGSFRGKISAKTEVAYQMAPDTYRANSVFPDEVIFLATGYLSTDIPLYAIEGADSALLLTDENFVLYHNESYTLPSLAEMKPFAVSVCETGGNLASEVDRLENEEAISGIINLLETEASHPKQSLDAYNVSQRFELLFHSEEYPAFDYVLEYWKYDEPVSFVNGDTEITVAKGVVYDRAARCFYVIGEQLESYFKNS